MLRLEEVQIALDAFRLGADLTLSPGLTAVIGPSGAGKSTLLAAIGGFLDVSGGRIRVNGQDITALPPADRPVAQVFQDGNLFPHLTIAANVALGLGPRVPRRPAAEPRVAEVLARVGLDGLGDRRPGQVSGGQQSRAALARVLVQDKPVVLLDEPFAALGPGLKTEMLDLTREVLAGAGRLVLMVTHDPTDAARIAETVVLVSEGEATGPHDRDQLFADPPPALRDYLGGEAETKKAR